MQIKNKFDPETQQKILKSFGLAAISAVAAAATVYLKTMDIKTALITGIAAFASFLVNVPVEYTKGIEETEE